jgi:pimeloyl-ACP methyl ester carboxylesterase
VCYKIVKGRKDMLIFVHGMLSNAEVWNPMINYFNERNFSCKAVNLKEGLNLRKTHFQDYVNKVKDIATEDDIIIGHSMGGLIVQKVAEEADLKGGVAVCSAAPKGVKYRGDIVLSSAKYAPQVIMGMPFKQDYRYVKKYMLVGIEEEKARNIYEKLEKQSAIVTYELGMNRITVDEKKVSCPLFFIATKQDGISPPELVQRLADKYHAEYKLYDGCHHFFSNENWSEIAGEIYNFITKI